MEEQNIYLTNEWNMEMVYNLRIATVCYKMIVFIKKMNDYLQPTKPWQTLDITRGKKIMHNPDTHVLLGTQNTGQTVGIKYTVEKTNG